MEPSKSYRYNSNDRFFQAYIDDTDVLAFSIFAMAATKTMTAHVHTIDLVGAAFSPAAPVVTMEFVVHFFALTAGAVLASYQVTGDMFGISFFLAGLAVAIGILPILNLIYIKLFWRHRGN